MFKLSSVGFNCMSVGLGVQLQCFGFEVEYKVYSV